ncbi:MAG TPA: TonB-dependent receptor [Steroidobacteraceae bacterium]|nr:TonB-dependent receptor [Steroidobacteraceae bacterium]
MARFDEMTTIRAAGRQTRAMAVACWALACSSAAVAQLAPQDPPNLQEIVVVGVSPVPGFNIDRDKIPGSIQTLRSSDLARNGAASVLGALDQQMGSVNFNDTLADPFQPEVLVRGFEASPVLGTPQGMAVYQNGVRINEAFGDTVNWDMIPDVAIDRIDVLSATSVFGLNALGGAATVTMKNGFTYTGFDATVSGGSFNQRQAQAEYGVNDGALGAYVAVNTLKEGGWRHFGQDRIRQYYLDLSFHTDTITSDLSYSRANNRLFGQGAAPVQSLAVSSENVFTGPQNNINNLDMLTLNTAYHFTPEAALGGVVYLRNYRQTVANGDNSDYAACDDSVAPGLLCDDDYVLTDTAGQHIPDITNGGATIIGQNDYEQIHSQSWGGSLQFSTTAKVAGHGNSFAVGATVDTATTNFLSGTWLGALDATLSVLPSPYFVDTPEGADSTATPVILDANNKYYGWFATDTFDVTDALSLTATGRYNIAKVDLADRNGTTLDGNNRFTHFDPSAGFTYELLPALTLYGDYAINNRAPTASELECANPAAPCLLPTNLASDPPLQQVIAKTVEVGARGNVSDAGIGRLGWDFSVYRTNSENDIYGISTSIASGFFQNVGSTRREGADLALTYDLEKVSAYLQYSYLKATFRSPLLEPSPANPFQDADGNIQVNVGDTLPLIPKTRVKLGGDVRVLPHWSVGGTWSYVGPSFYRGDEANLNPELPGYSVASLRTSYQLGRHVQLFANIQNLFDRRYSTFGILGDPTGVGAPGVPADGEFGDPDVDPRFQSPAMPRAYFGGVKVSF